MYRKEKNPNIAAMDPPEEIIMNMISRLPMKSLIRWTSVSKRWHSIILFDKQFADQHQRNKILARRALVVSYPPKINDEEYAEPVSHLESLDLETLSFRRLNFSFPDPDTSPFVMGSCNGFVFIAYATFFYVFNPSTGFVKELPLPGYSTNACLRAYGVGYLPATDDYKVFVNFRLKKNGTTVTLYEMMSLKDQIWRSVEVPKDFCGLCVDKGALVNEALHWLNPAVIVAFDLAKEEFWEMRLPSFGQDWKYDNYLGVCFGGCLCVLRCRPTSESDSDYSVDFWVMREYQVTESWTKLYHIKFPNLQSRMYLLMITENYAVFEDEPRYIKICHKQEGEEPSFDILDTYINEEGEEELIFDILHGTDLFEVIEYEESLVSMSLGSFS